MRRQDGHRKQWHEMHLGVNPPVGVDGCTRDPCQRSSSPLAFGHRTGLQRLLRGPNHALRRRTTRRLRCLHVVSAALSRRRRARAAQVECRLVCGDERCALLALKQPVARLQDRGPLLREGNVSVPCDGLDADGMTFLTNSAVAVLSLVPVKSRLVMHHNHTIPHHITYDF